MGEYQFSTTAFRASCFDKYLGFPGMTPCPPMFVAEMDMQVKHANISLLAKSNNKYFLIMYKI